MRRWKTDGKTGGSWRASRPAASSAASRLCRLAALPHSRRSSRGRWRIQRAITGRPRACRTCWLRLLFVRSSMPLADCSSRPGAALHSEPTAECQTANARRGGVAPPEGAEWRVVIGFGSPAGRRTPRGPLGWGSCPKACAPPAGSSPWARGRALWRPSSTARHQPRGRPKQPPAGKCLPRARSIQSSRRSSVCLASGRPNGTDGLSGQSAAGGQAVGVFMKTEADSRA